MSGPLQGEGTAIVGSFLSWLAVYVLCTGLPPSKMHLVEMTPPSISRFLLRATAFFTELDRLP